jgi:hypothetical protein
VWGGLLAISRHSRIMRRDTLTCVGIILQPDSPFVPIGAEELVPLHHGCGGAWLACKGAVTGTMSILSTTAPIALKRGPEVEKYHATQAEGTGRGEMAPSSVVGGCAQKVG